MKNTFDEMAVCFVKNWNMLWFYSETSICDWQMRPSIRCVESPEYLIPPWVLVTYLISDIRTLNIIMLYFLDLKEYWAKTPEDKMSLEVFSWSEMQTKIITK